MRKLNALFQNEMLKTFKKVSIYVILLIMTVGIITLSVIAKIGYNGDVSFGQETYYDTPEYYMQEAETYRNSIAAFEDRLQDSTLTEEQRVELKKSLLSLKSEQIHSELYGAYVKEHAIEKVSFRYDILSYMEGCLQTQLNLEYAYGDTVLPPDMQERYDNCKTQYAALDKLVTGGTYSDFIAFEIEEIQNDAELTAEEKASQIESKQSLLTICPSGEYRSQEERNNANSLINQKASLRSSIDRHTDPNYGGNLTKEREAELEKELKLINNKIENRMIATDTDRYTPGYSYALAMNIGMICASIILIILAGSMMSHEMSTGTIKSLIIAPVKRWKIYTAKYISLIVSMVMLTLYVYAVSSLATGFLFGFGTYQDKVVLFGGKILTMNYFVYQLLSILLQMVPLLVFMTFAYMLSVVTKNTGVSVSVTMGIYFGGNILHLMFLQGMMNGYAYLEKFLPFSNLSWFDRMFYGGASAETGSFLFGSELSEAVSRIPLVFSIIYIIIILICMVYVGLDSFCRKDIK